MERNTEEPLVSVIILAYNGEKFIEDCLKSVCKQIYKNLEIIVIDNNSSDRTVEIAENFKRNDSRIEIVRNLANLEFTGGNNMGMNRSKGKFVLCINQDIELNEDFLKKELDIFKGDRKIGVVQAKLLDRKGFIDTVGIDALKNRRFVDRGQRERDNGQYERGEEIFGFNGAAPFFRKECLDDIKILGERGYEFYDSDFLAYKDDIDLSWRIRLYGWKIFYCPVAIAYVDRSSMVGPEKKAKYMQIAGIRRKQNFRVRYNSFKNQRLMQIKNELPGLFFQHLPWILPKEIASWLYVIFLEPKTWPAIIELFKQTPSAWRKRKIIMKNKRVGAEEMKIWFN
jgi:GT2 family glycosyltransferase